MKQLLIIFIICFVLGQSFIKALDNADLTQLQSQSITQQRLAALGE